MLVGTWAAADWAIRFYERHASSWYRASAPLRYSMVDDPPVLSHKAVLGRALPSPSRELLPERSPVRRPTCEPSAAERSSEFDAPLVHPKE